MFIDAINKVKAIIVLIHRRLVEKSVCKLQASSLFQLIVLEIITILFSHDLTCFLFLFLINSLILITVVCSVLVGFKVLHIHCCMERDGTRRYIFRGANLNK